jgi:hypothetical protein
MCTLCLPINKVDPDLSYADGQKVLKGYLVGDRFIPDDARVVPDPDKLVEQTCQVYCVELGLERFARAMVVRNRHGRLVYMSQEFPQGPEAEVLEAYQDRAVSVTHIKDVTPPLDLAFRWISRQRELVEERRRELERVRAEERRERERQERIKQAMECAGTSVGRRNLAQHDFGTAAMEALKVSGAEFLDARPGFSEKEVVVQYRFRNRRFECVVDRATLRVIDSGICLTDHDTGEKGDTWLTLESLPGVVGEAIDLNKLVVYRHA